MAEIFRQAYPTLLQRLSEPVRLINIVAGPRQVGKSTLVRQVLRLRPPNTYLSLSADPASESAVPLPFAEDDLLETASGSPRDAEWLERCWKTARARQRALNGNFVLAIDEVQKVPQWSSIVKGLWDADRAANIDLHVILLGSSPLLVQKGLSESLAGRHELLRLAHWSFLEMREAFAFELADYIYFGGYPGSAHLLPDERRWREFVRNSLATPSIDKDILFMTRVDKPALLKQLFSLGCELSGQIVSYTKLLGQLQDAGNTVTLAHYLELLGNAGLMCGLQKYSGSHIRQRASSPKLNVLNTALMSIACGYDFASAQADRTFWGRLVETAVGAHLCNTAEDDCHVQYWREGASEVDFIVEYRGRLTAIEVKSATRQRYASGLTAFSKAFGECRTIQIGGGGVPLPEFLACSATHWAS